MSNDDVFTSIKSVETEFVRHSASWSFDNTLMSGNSSRPTSSSVISVLCETLSSSSLWLCEVHPSKLWTRSVSNEIWELVSFELRTRIGSTQSASWTVMIRARSCSSPLFSLSCIVLEFGNLMKCHDLQRLCRYHDNSGRILCTSHVLLHFVLLRLRNARTLETRSSTCRGRSSCNSQYRVSFVMSVILTMDSVCYSAPSEISFDSLYCKYVRPIKLFCKSNEV